MTKQSGAYVVGLFACDRRDFIEEEKEEEDDLVEERKRGGTDA